MIRCPAPRRRGLAWASLLLAAGDLFLAGCQTCPPSGAAAPEGGRPAQVREQVILLPSPDGQRTAITVRAGQEETVLDHAYAAATVIPGQAIATRTASPAEVEAIAGAALRALPVRPVVFQLYFDLDSVRIQAESARLLARIVAEIARRQTPDVSIIGHTDRSGDPEYNQALSLRRAAEVRRLLAEQGAGGSITVVGKGETENVVAQTKRTPERRNRRVEVIVR